MVLENSESDPKFEDTESVDLTEELLEDDNDDENPCDVSFIVGEISSELRSSSPLSVDVVSEVDCEEEV